MQRSRRLPDWEARLSAWLAASRDRPHTWGANDCLLWIAGAVEAQTGEDPGETWRGRYTSLNGCVRLMRRRGFDCCAAVLDSLFPQVPVGFAQRGDIVTVEDAPGLVLGGEARLLLHDGAVNAPRAAWTSAWAVGAARGEE